MEFLIFIIAMGALIWGADKIVEQSEKIALHLNISEFVIGATLVALGTSLPEMAASMAASANNHPEIAISNVIGSNILNITLVLAIIFLIVKELNPDRDFFAKDSIWALMPIMMFLLMAIDGIISRFDAALLLLLMIAYVMFLLKDAKGLGTEEVDELAREEFSWFSSITWILIGFILVVGGANFAVDSASGIARGFGVSEWVIGIIMISFGTSLPELVVSVSAAMKNKVEMAIGNIIGSNLANTSVVLGAAAMVKPMDFAMGSYIFDISTMVVATLMLVFIAANRLYSKPAGISLVIVLGLFLNNTLQSLA
ncbi:calcium/sodium antiporter [Sulfurovum sp. zt1-1]|uniref:Calcium/sodium antiporter n=1 Tax=Sulfurovum zhangzhouensis TaxID=3019067 RepID=A0ABT7QXW8_9BACT|nr:calcium/sodium antiporter [Sulfurovum zhangzhouensis]MDM5271683.1 calcium/sodium antiporter [Sulfurovum zhangzhouensis]